MTKRRQQSTPTLPDADLRKQLRMMAAEIHTLTDQVHVLEAEVKHIPRLPRALADPPLTGRMSTTSRVLRSGEHEIGRAHV